MHFAIAAFAFVALPALAHATSLDVRLPWNHNRTIISCNVSSESVVNSNTIVAELDCGLRGSMTVSTALTNEVRTTADIILCDVVGEPVAVSISRYVLGNEEFSGIDGSACRR